MIKKLKLNPKQLKKSNNGLNIFDLGTLIQFETHAWQARKKLPNNIARKIAPNIEKNLIRANKDLIDKSHLQDINKIIYDTRNYITFVANPFPIKGIHFVNKDLVPKIKETLDEYNNQLNNEVNIFIQHYEKFINEAEKELSADGLFNYNDYPKLEDIKNKFSITYRFFDLTIPTHINEEMKQTETENFQKLMTQTKEMGILALRESFKEIITHLTDTFTGKLNDEDKRLHQASLEKVHTFFNMFQNKNIFNDNELENLIHQAVDILDGVDSDSLKNDDDLVKLINNQLLDVKKEIDHCVVSYKRKLTFI